MNGMKLMKKPEQDPIRQSQDYLDAMKTYDNMYNKTYVSGAKKEKMNYTAANAIEYADNMFDACKNNSGRANAYVAATIDVLTDKRRKPNELMLVLAGNFIRSIASSYPMGEVNNPLASAIINNVLPGLPTGIGPLGGRHELDLQVLRAILGGLNELNIEQWKGVFPRDFTLQAGYLKTISTSIEKLDEIAKKNNDAAKKNPDYTKEIASLAENLSHRLKEAKG